MRFHPLQRLSARGSGITAGFPRPDDLRLQVFSTSWRFHPPRAPRPYFMPDPLLGFRPPELSSSAAGDRCLHRSIPSCRQPRRRDLTLLSVRRRAYLGNASVSGTARLKPDERAPTSGACSTGESASRTPAVKPDERAQLSWASTLQGIPPRRPGPAFAAPPLSQLAAPGPKARHCSAPGFSVPPRLADLSRGCLPSWDSPTF